MRLSKIFILAFIFTLSVFSGFSQLAVNSDFNEDISKLNVRITNKSGYIIHISNGLFVHDPSYVAIESYDRNGNRIEWLIGRPLRDIGYLPVNGDILLKPDESCLLSFKINRDKEKVEPAYMIVNYDFKCSLLENKNIETLQFPRERYKYLRGHEFINFKERFDLEVY